jgi:hypothetical protein
MLDGCTKFSGKAAVRNNDDANHARMSILLTFAGRRLPRREPRPSPRGRMMVSRPARSKWKESAVGPLST